MDFKRASTSELLSSYREALAELRRREIVCTGNAPTGDYAETLIKVAFKGELARIPRSRGMCLRRTVRSFG